MSGDNQNHNNSHKPVVRPNGNQFQIGLRARERATGDGEANVDFSEIWDTVREGKWTILLTCVIVMGAIAAYTMTLPLVYEAESIVAVERETQAATGITGFDRRPNLSSEIGLLENSAALAERVAKRMIETAETVQSEDYFPVLLDEGGNVRSAEESGRRLTEKTSFTPNTDQQMIRITVESQVPEEAAAIANMYSEEYQEYSLEQSRAGVVAAREFLEEQVERHREEIEELERQWETFAREHDVMTRGEGGQRIAEEYTGLQSRRSELEFQLEQERRSLQVIESQLNQFEPELRSRVMEEQDVSQTQASISAINQQIAELRAEAAPWYINNPELEGNEQEEPELAEIKRQIEGYEGQRAVLLDEMLASASDRSAAIQEGGALSRIAQLRDRAIEVEMTINELEAQIVAIDEKLATYGEELDELPRQRIEYDRLEQRIAQQEQFYSTIVSELQRTIMQEESELGYVQSVRSAMVPSAPVSPNLEQNIVLGFLLGLGFGIGLAFLKRAMTSQMRTPKDVQSTGFSVVGVIPRMDREVKSLFNGKQTVEVGGRQLSTRLLPLLNPWSPIAENYRLVRTNLQHSNSGTAPEAILITSPEQGDGKTLTAVNVAITMAQSGRRTLLIDADLRRPNTHNLLDMNYKPGVANLLSSDGAIPDHIQPTEVEGLHLLPAGEIDKPPAELLGSSRMKQIIDYYRDHYDVIIVDSPPVLAVSDPILLSKHCDATLLVVAANRTASEAIEIAEQTFDAVGEPISGVVFNRFDERKRSGYGYGYEYKYSEYGYASYGRPKVTDGNT